MPEYPNPKLRSIPEPPPAAVADRLAYAELDVTTNFSFLRGASHPDELVFRAAELGYRAIAVTDRNTVAGVVRMHEAAGLTGMKLLIGCRLSLMDAPDVLVWASDRAAYAQLCRLLTIGKRRSEKGECTLWLNDVIACSTSDEGKGERRSDEGRDTALPSSLCRFVASPSPFVAPSLRRFVASPSLLLALVPPEPICDRTEHALRLLRDAVGDRLSLATSCLYAGNQRQRMEQLLELSRAYDTPLLATNNVHYHDPTRRPLQDVLTCVRLGCTIGEAGHRLFPNAERYLKTPAQMHRLFAGHPEAIRRGVEIAERCTFSLDELRYEYPDEVVPDGRTPHEHLRELTEIGVRKHYPQGAPAKVRQQIEHELALIGQLRYEAYFLTVYDLVTFARSRGILCQGRGSAANSAVCYCLGVTSVDPSVHDLLFERFISAARNEPPDIDIDFEHERREEVIQYVYQKYGRERAGMTAEVITYRGRSAVRDVGKALGLSLDMVDHMAKKLDWWDRGTLQHEQLRECGLDPADATVRRVVGLTGELLGFPRHLSQHVGGLVMTRGPLCEMVPIENASMEDRTVIEWDKDDIDTVGILKVDVLALGMLTCISKCFGLVEGMGNCGLRIADCGLKNASFAQGTESGADPVGPKARISLDENPPTVTRVFNPCEQCGTSKDFNFAQSDTALNVTRASSPCERCGTSGIDSSREIQHHSHGLKTRVTLDASTDEIRACGPTGSARPDSVLCETDASWYSNPQSKIRDSTELVEVNPQSRDSVPCANDTPHPLRLELHTIPPNDPAVYDMIADADTIGVFQVESRAQMSMLPRLRPRCFYDLVIEVAIVRPGPIQGNMVHPYLRRRNGEEPVSFPSEALRQVLEKTLGVPLFQEQAMKIAMVAAGFSADEADKLRRAMAAWRKGGAIEKFHEKLVAGMIANGYTPEFAEQTFLQIRGFGEYGFPESHSASFAHLVYVSAWLKRYHPAAFCAAILNSQPMGFYAPAQLVRDAKEHGVEVRPADVNLAEWDCLLEEKRRSDEATERRREREEDFALRTLDCGLEEGASNVTRVSNPCERCGTSETHSSQEIQHNLHGLTTRVTSTHKSTWGLNGPAVRLGFRNIKGLREAHANRIASVRRASGPFVSVTDLHCRTGLPKHVLQRLAEADAFTSLGLSRRQALWEVLALKDEEAPLFDGKTECEASDGATKRRSEEGRSREVTKKGEAQPDATSVSFPSSLRRFVASSLSARPSVASSLSPPLPPMPLHQEVMTDYATIGLSLKKHPVALVREQLAARKVITAAELMRTPQGRWVRLAGLVLIRQRPGTASGIVFETLEDETGSINLIIRPHVYDRYRVAARHAYLAQADGWVEREGQVVHVMVQRMHDLSGLLEGYGVRSRDFH